MSKSIHYRVVHTLNGFDFIKAKHGMKTYDTLEEAQEVVKYFHDITESVGKHPEGPVEIRRITEITEVVEAATA